jgi:hypothetical protein
MLIGGYRPHPQWLIYGGPSLVYQPYRSTSTMAPPDDETLEGAARSHAFTVGIEFGKSPWRFQLECTRSAVRAADETAGQVNCGLAFSGYGGVNP